MSDEARDYVKRRSPFTGSTYWLHYVLGDIANKQHGYEIWVTDKTLAEEWPLSVRSIERGRAELVEGGFLKVLDGVTAPGRPLRYRFVFKGEESGRENTRQSGGRNTRQPDGRTEANTRQSGEDTRQPDGRTPAKSENAPLINQREPKGTELARPRNFGDEVADQAKTLAALATEQRVKPPSWRKALAVIADALHRGRTYAEIERAIKAGVDVWTEPGLATAIAKSTRVPTRQAAAANAVVNRMAQRRGITVDQ